MFMWQDEKYQFGKLRIVNSTNKKTIWSQSSIIVFCANKNKITTFWDWFIIKKIS